MKLGFILLFIIVGISQTSISQLSLRPQLGIQMADLTFESAQGELNAQSGISIGADLQVGKTFYLQPGLIVNPIKFDLDNVGDIRITKLNIPIMVGYKFFEPEGKKSFGFRLYAGPNFAFTVNENIDDAINDITLDNLNNFHLSSIAGVGLDLSIFFVDLGYKFGLTKTISHSSGNYAKLNAILINTGIRIGF
jgi:hypothetical protein